MGMPTIIVVLTNAKANKGDSKSAKMKPARKYTNVFSSMIRIFFLNVDLRFVKPQTLPFLN